MGNILRKELEEILVYLKTEVTPEDLQWLNAYIPEIPWAECEMRKWNEKYASDKLKLHERITEIMDAKKRMRREHGYSDRLDLEELLEIARIFSLNISWKIGIAKIVEMLFEEIRKCKCCQRGGRTGTAR